MRRTDVWLDSLNQLWLGIRDSAGCALEPLYEEARAGDVRDSVADLGRARELLGFEPSVDLRGGLRPTVESFAKTTGPGCCVLHNAMARATMGTSMNPTMPITAPYLAALAGSVAKLRTRR